MALFLSGRNLNGIEMMLQDFSAGLLIGSFDDPQTPGSESSLRPIFAGLFGPEICMKAVTACLKCTHSNRHTTGFTTPNCNLNHANQGFIDITGSSTHRFPSNIKRLFRALLRLNRGVFDPSNPRHRNCKKTKTERVEPNTFKDLIGLLMACLELFWTLSRFIPGHRWTAIKAVQATHE